MAKIYSEKQIVADVLKIYKEKPCLWNPNDEQYGHKAARELAFMEMLDKYRVIFENATVEQLKKKIDHLRSAYRRERRKVLAARQEGEVHLPVLWYYHHLTFLNDEDDLNTSKDETSVATYLQENENGDYELEEVPKKRTKLEEILLATPISPNQISYEHATNPIKEEHEESIADLESESFGRTIGLQLRELHPTQRYIAEKLISEIIFYARLDQLRTNSSIVTD